MPSYSCNHYISSLTFDIYITDTYKDFISYIQRKNSVISKIIYILYRFFVLPQDKIEYPD